MARHNKLRDGLAHLEGKPFTPYHVHDDPLIYSGHATKRTNVTPAGASRNKDYAVVPPPEVTEQKGDLLIRDLCQKGTDSDHNTRVLKTDTH